MKKAYLLSLGCPRNLVDSEVLLGLLEKKGFDIVENPAEADIAIVNTCGFLQDAKQESIDMILQLADLKIHGSIKKLVVSGCLSQRYPAELMDRIKEIDGVFGTDDFVKIPEKTDMLFAGGRVREVTSTPCFLYDHRYERKILTLPHYVYVKIQEGCSNGCSYCVIPDLKGPRRSRTIESVLKEIKNLKAGGDIRELILIGQDTTSFGIDRGEGTPELAELLRRTSPAMKDGWVRLLYTHPAHFTDELIEVLADTDNICKYVDLPIQHINDRILRRMNRRITRAGITSLIERLRRRIRGVTIRTSVIVGFPGETDGEFRELLDFLDDIKFDRLGAFIYSREEGTAAAGFKGQVPRELKEARFDEVMRLQQRISAENNQAFLGKNLKILIDEEDATDPEQFVGRSQMDAPEVDGVIYVRGRDIRAGDFVDVRVTGTMEYDLIGEIV
ncbi:MAG: 30S ribosomal protein S12 methylthiotransferase RimO [Candidatus Makaraimicrobium thalassicum]|nr:MAG: 30S ribosomal protein S12 methylthiotransferase RimO [Candidatus Omnitrophota bacterium]